MNELKRAKKNDQPWNSIKIGILEFYRQRKYTYICTFNTVFVSSRESQRWIKVGRMCMWVRNTMNDEKVRVCLNLKILEKSPNENVSVFIFNFFFVILWSNNSLFFSKLFAILLLEETCSPWYLFHKSTYLWKILFP